MIDSMGLAVAGLALAGGSAGYLLGSPWLLERVSTTFERRRAHLDKKMRFLRLGFRGGHAVWAEIVCVLACLVALALGTFWLGLVPLLALPLGNRALTTRCEARVQRIHLQVESLLESLARALAAAPSLGDAIASCRAALSGPLADELGEVLEEMHLGASLEVALDNMVKRVPSENLRLAVLTVTVAARSGGQLEQVLLSTAAAMREMERLEGFLRAKTAEGRVQTFVISLLPPPVLYLISVSQPGFFDPLEASFGGHVLLGIALILWGGAIVLARYVLAVEL